MVRITKNSFFTKIILSLLIFSSFQVNAVFSFKDLTGNISKKYNNAKKFVKDVFVISLVGLAAVALIYLSNNRAFSNTPNNGTSTGPFSRPEESPDLKENKKERQELLNLEFIIEEPVKKFKKLVVKEHEVAEGETKECFVCMADKNPKDFYKMSCCGVEFCRACLSAIVGNVIKNNNIELLRCPNFRCIDKKNNLQIRGKDLENLVSGNNLKIIEGIAEKNRRKKLPGYRHCSTPNCNVCYVIPDNKKGDIVCPKCNVRRCANCQISHFSNETCEHAIAEKERLENLTLNEAEKETKKVLKECPRCKKKIFRDNGCKHMNCLKAEGGCGFNFCWDCLGHLPVDYDHENGGYPHSHERDGGSTAFCPLHPELVGK